ncbi:MAG: peptidoglycan-binding protein [Pseudomonadota bacterium]
MNSRLPWSDRQSDYEPAGTYDYPANSSSDRGFMAESSALHQKLNELSNQLSQMVAPDASQPRDLPQAPQQDPATPSNAEQTMRSLMDRIENNELSSSNSLSQLNRQLSNLADKLDRETPAPSPTPSSSATFDVAIKNVMSHVEESEARTRSTLKSLQDRIAEIGARAASSDSKGVQDTAGPIEDLERRLAGIAAKLDKQETAAKKDSRIESLEKKISELAESLPDPGMLHAHAQGDGTVDAGTFFGAGDPTKTILDSLEQRMDALANEVRSSAGNSLSKDDVSRLWTDQSTLAEQIRQLKASTASNRDLQSMRSSLEQLTKQVNVNDDASRYDQVNQRINELAHKLENTLPNTAELAKTGELEAKILQLDARLSAAQSQPDNGPAIRALEAQVRQVADRLSDHERKLDTISELEASIAQLTSRLQTTRNEVTQSAEMAATRMAEQLRVEVDSKVNESTAPDASAELRALQQGLNAIQNSSQSADRRTHETLVAVHDTLDSVIERMNQIEAARAAVAADSGMPVAAISPAAKIDPLTPPAPLAEPAPAFATPQPEQPTVAAQIGTFAAQPEPAAEPQPELFSEPEPLSPPSLDASTPAEAQPHTPRQDFIAAAREAARAAGHGGAPAGPAAAPSLQETSAAPHLGGQFSAPQATSEAGGKHRQLLLAGAMALLIGAVAAYGLINGYQSKDGAKPNPRVTRTAPTPTSTAPVQVAPPVAPAGARTGDGSVQPAESVPFDPTAPQQNGNLVDQSTASPDPIQTASVSNVDGKSDSPRPPAGSVTLDGSVPTAPTSTLKSNPALDPNVTSIGAAPVGTTSDALVPLTPTSDARSAAPSDPFVTGALPNPQPTGAETSDSLTPEQAKLLAGLPKALGPEEMLWSAAKGDRIAQFMVATRYSDGKAVKKDFDKAAIWYHKAASKGLAPAQYRLGTLYERGRGVKQDIKSAKAWYEHAAHRGHIKAMHNLAVLHANSPGGRAKFNQASYWFKKAANLGLKDSQYNLAILYEEGLGVQKDIMEAYRWYSLAAKQKDKDAAKRLAKVKSTLQADDMNKANQLVETWRPVKAKFSANVVTPPIGGWQKPESVKVRGTTQEHAGFALGPATKEAQKLLNAIGYDAGVPDGQMGPRTARAIRQFQSQHGHQPTGTVTPKLLEQLRNLPG